MSHDEDNDQEQELISCIYWSNLHAAQPLSFSIFLQHLVLWAKTKSKFWDTSDSNYNAVKLMCNCPSNPSLKALNVNFCFMSRLQCRKCSDKAPWAIRNSPTCSCHFFISRLTYCRPKLIKFFPLQPCLGEITSYMELICSRKCAQKRSWPITFSIKIIREWKLAHVVGHKGIKMNIFTENALLFTE